MIIKHISRRGGIIGNIIGMIMMPCCFPIMISLLATMGIYTLSMGPATLYLISGSAVLMNISHILHTRQTRHHYQSIISIGASVLVLYYLWIGGSVRLYYSGLILLFGLSMYQLYFSYHNKQCCTR